MEGRLVSLPKVNTRDTCGEGTILFSIFFVTAIQGPTPVREPNTHTEVLEKPERRGTLNYLLWNKKKNTNELSRNNVRKKRTK